jgi:hypothetical protein
VNPESALGHFETKSDAGRCASWSHPPPEADVLALGRQGGSCTLFNAARHRRSVRCHDLEHVADLQSPGAGNIISATRKASAGSASSRSTLFAIAQHDNKRAVYQLNTSQHGQPSVIRIPATSSISLPAPPRAPLPMPDVSQLRRIAQVAI